MCLSPVRIPNPRKFRRLHLDSSDLYVNCGHCPECEAQLTNDWFVRLNYEYLNYKSKKGCVYFLTLTYNDACVPMVTDNDFIELTTRFNIDAPLFSGMCFNKKHIVQFFKDFRAFFKSKYGIDGIKHFTVTEYGTDPDKTHRPHYHILLFFPVRFEPSVVRSVANYCWSERVRYENVPSNIIEQSNYPSVQMELSKYNYHILQGWVIAPPSSPRHKKPMFKRRYGFTSWSKYGAIVQSSACLRYILKYLFKDRHFMSSSVGSGLEYILNRCPSLAILEEQFPPVDPLGCPDFNYQKQLEMGEDFFQTNPEFVKYHRLIQSVRDCLPFHLQSVKLGDTLFNDIVSDWENGKKILENNVINFPQDINNYKVPRYIIRRLFYDVGKDKLNRHYAKYTNYVYLNEIGKECLIDFIDFKAGRYNDYIDMYTSAYYVSLMSKEFVSGWYEKFGISFNQSLSQLRNLPLDTRKLLFYYQLVFKDVFCFDAHNLPSDVNSWLVLGKDMYISKVRTSDMRELDSTYFELLPEHYRCSLNPDAVMDVYDIKQFNECGVFYEFDDYLKWLNGIREAVVTYKCQSKSEKYDRLKIIRSLYNRYIYKNYG